MIEHVINEITEYANSLTNRMTIHHLNTGLIWYLDHHFETGMEQVWNPLKLIKNLFKTNKTGI